MWDQKYWFWVLGALSSSHIKLLHSAKRDMVTFEIDPAKWEMVKAGTVGSKPFLTVILPMEEWNFLSQKQT